METPELDLTGFMPMTIVLRLGAERTVEVSSDQPPALISQANVWLDSYQAGNADADTPVDMEEGWRLVNEICGQDMHEIGVLAAVKLLTFFRGLILVKLQEIYSVSPSKSAESSTEESASETSSPAVPSSESVSTS